MKYAISLSWKIIQENLREIIHITGSKGLWIPSLSLLGFRLKHIILRISAIESGPGRIFAAMYRNWDMSCGIRLEI